RLPVDSLARRARILQAIGEDDEERGRPEAALAEFHEAWRTTSALLAKAPDDPERIFDHAQSEYYLGLVDYDKKRYGGAERGFQKYRYYIGRLKQVAPHDSRTFHEMGYAEGALCSLFTKVPARK